MRKMPSCPAQRMLSTLKPSKAWKCVLNSKLGRAIVLTWPCVWPQSTLGPLSKPAIDVIAPAARGFVSVFSVPSASKMRRLPSEYATMTWPWNSSMSTTALVGGKIFETTRLSRFTTATPFMPPMNKLTPSTISLLMGPGMLSDSVCVQLKVFVPGSCCHNLTSRSAPPLISTLWWMSMDVTRLVCPVSCRSTPSGEKAWMLPLHKPQNIQPPLHNKLWQESVRGTVISGCNEKRPSASLLGFHLFKLLSVEQVKMPCGVIAMQVTEAPCAL
mmetsp:Transcript_22875/g.60236  ORF Transcript_22875/g.60236 Transcript_22875/m.60236 type:complete len:272 (-) Transcript_22875:313-1128(-)